VVMPANGRLRPFRFQSWNKEFRPFVRTRN
jgi:hypothetical protein